jgi:hypothetical protein
VSTTRIAAMLRRSVEERATQRCEYCLLPSGTAFFPHEVDHVIPEKHGGRTEAANLALTCWRCNRHKGTDLASFDPETGQFSLLFNPRTQRWHDHFRFSEGILVGLTPEGRTTVQLLQMNRHERVQERQQLVIVGRYLLPETE